MEQPKWMLLLKSRKFWAAVVGLGLVVLRFFLPSFPLSDDDVARLVYVVIAYILGTALEDGLAVRSIVARSDGARAVGEK